MAQHLGTNGTEAPSTLSLLGLVGFVVPVTALHGLRPELDPVSTFLSEYAIGPYRLLWTGALFALGLGSLVLCAGLRHTTLVRQRVALALLTVWSLGTIVAGVFPTDPGGVPVSVRGIIHGVAASVGFLSFVVAAMILSVRFGREPGWCSARSPGLRLAVLALMSMVGFFAAPAGLKGITERAFVLIVITWLAFVSVWLHRVGQDRSGATYS